MLETLRRALPEEIEDIKRTSQRYIVDWYTSHSAVVPTKEDVKEVLNLLPTSPEWYAALSDARSGKGNHTHALISAIALSNQNSKRPIITNPPGNAIYIGSVQATLGKLPALIGAISNTYCQERERMAQNLSLIASDLKATGHSAGYPTSLLYGGCSTQIAHRSQFDVLSYGSPKSSHPLVQAQTIGAGAQSLSDCSFITFDKEGPILHGYGPDFLGPNDTPPP